MQNCNPWDFLVFRSLSGMKTQLAYAKTTHDESFQNSPCVKVPANWNLSIKSLPMKNLWKFTENHSLPQKLFATWGPYHGTILENPSWNLLVILAWNHCLRTLLENLLVILAWNPCLRTLLENLLVILTWNSRLRTLRLRNVANRNLAARAWQRCIWKSLGTSK